MAAGCASDRRDAGGWRASLPGFFGTARVLPAATPTPPAPAPAALLGIPPESGEGGGGEATARLEVTVVVALQRPGAREALLRLLECGMLLEQQTMSRAGETVESLAGIVGSRPAASSRAAAAGASSCVVVSQLLVCDDPLAALRAGEGLAGLAKLAVSVDQSTARRTGKRHLAAEHPLAAEGAESSSGGGSSTITAAAATSVLLVDTALLVLAIDEARRTRSRQPPRSRLRSQGPPRCCRECMWPVVAVGSLSN